MAEHKTGCLVCGRDLIYGTRETRECYYCGEIFDANVTCECGHYVCDKCHGSSANDLIENLCISTGLEDPYEIALILMRSPKIKMHGPEHHFLVPAALITAYYNIKKDHKEKVLKIKEAKKRSLKILGGFCGFYGNCGAAVGTGIFISLITNSTPLSINEWRLSNLITARSLLTIADHGGPRCCKRNTFLALREAVEFVKSNFGMAMSAKENIQCEFKDENKECLMQKCPHYPYS